MIIQDAGIERLRGRYFFIKQETGSAYFQQFCRDYELILKKTCRVLQLSSFLKCRLEFQENVFQTEVVFASDLKKQIKKLRHVPAEYHKQSSCSVHSDFKNYSLVFIRDDSVRKSLKLSCLGTFKVQHFKKIFKLDVIGKEKNIIKPALSIIELPILALPLNSAEQYSTE